MNIWIIKIYINYYNIIIYKEKEKINILFKIKKYL